MITYELANRLKEAGFPQGAEPTMYGYDKKGVKYVYGYGAKLVEGSVKIPTLSELIQACGHIIPHESEDYKLIIWFNGTDWSAGYLDSFVFRDVIDGTVDPYVQGKTPEEAVASLWLKLNKPSP